MTKSNDSIARENQAVATIDPETTKKDLELAELSRAFIKKENRLTDLEQRLLRIEKRIKSNERFARTFAGCMSTQVLAIDAVTDVLRRALREDIVIQDELMSAIRHYDKHKFRRWCSGFFSVLLWILSVMLAAFAGAFIYWVFSGQQIRYKILWSKLWQKLLKLKNKNFSVYFRFG